MPFTSQKYLLGYIEIILDLIFIQKWLYYLYYSILSYALLFIHFNNWIAFCWVDDIKFFFFISLAIDDSLDYLIVLQWLNLYTYLNFYTYLCVLSVGKVLNVNWKCRQFWKVSLKPLNHQGRSQEILICLGKYCTA